MEPNPFTPGFGQVPPVLAGREYLVRDIDTALRLPGHDPNLTTLFVGARGTGKTTMLNLIAERAASCGWICAQVSSVPGMLNDVLARARRSGQQLLDSQDKTHLTSLGIGGVFSVGWKTEGATISNWRSSITDMLDVLEPLGSGLLITIDEVQAGFDELSELASVYQHLVGERRRIALMMAGLPYQVSRVLNDKSISFLRRAFRHSLGRIDDLAILDAFQSTVTSHGRTIAPDALNLAVDAIDGSPFMMQLVGYRVWSVHPEEPTITMSDAQKGCERARIEMRERILETTWEELSEGDIRFVEAMLKDRGNSRMADIAHRMGVSPGYAAQYRRRLMEAGVIGQRSHGVVGFDLPGWRDFVWERLGVES